ncbi:MAG: dihydrolipoamide acetyltransferase family protein [Phycisphaerae bacterium]
MPVKIEMPRLSDTMQAGTVVKWNVKEGDKVKSGQALADIETDKATMELPCYDDGVVAAVPVPAGQNVPIGTVILVLAQAGEDPAAVKAQFAAGGASAPAKAAPAKAAAAPAKVSAPAASHAVAPLAVGAGVSSHAPAHANGHSHAPSRVFASPLARKIAADSGVDLGALQGSGPSGRIIRRDVEAALAGGATAAVATPTTYVAPQLSPSGTKLAGKVVTLSNMRRVIATRLVESKTTVPHYQVSVDVDMDALIKLRGDLNDQLASQGVKLSVNDFLVRACALAMHQHPYVNSRWVPTPGQEAIELLSDVNIGVAISLPEDRGGGLVVATLRNADQTGLRQISAQSKSLADKARAKGLSPQEMSDSTFTISNLGMFGVSHFTAIINPPNAAILAVGAAIQKPVVRNGQLAVGHVMTMTMSSDHRIIDGAMAAAYLTTVKGLLEKPATLLV